MLISDAKVLLVEDDPLMREFTIGMLKRLGVAQVKECVDGTAALREVTSFQPDLVLTDVHMEPMSGLEFVKKLSRMTRSAGDRYKVIMMSADSSRETLSEALPLGVHAYIVKPPRLSDLKVKIEAALRDQ